MAKRTYGFISNKERDKRVRQSNQSYGLRKLFITLTVIALAVLVVFAIITVVNFTNAASNYQKGGDAQAFIKELCNMPLTLFATKEISGGFQTTLSGFGWFMAIWAVLTIGLSIVSLILMLTMRSPKSAKANINRLQSAAISGKKLESHANASQVYRDRATNSKKLKSKK